MGKPEPMTATFEVLYNGDWGARVKNGPTLGAGQDIPVTTASGGTVNKRLKARISRDPDGDLWALEPGTASNKSRWSRKALAGR